MFFNNLYSLLCCIISTGGVGILATGPLNAEETRKSIQEIKARTDKPFGIGATLLMPGAIDNAKVAIEEEVPVINISLGKGDWIAEQVHGYGGKVLATVTNAKHAESAIVSGADALMLTGHEAAAHGGDVTSLVLIPSLAKQFPDIPLVVSMELICIAFYNGLIAHLLILFLVSVMASGCRWVRGWKRFGCCNHSRS